MFSEKLLSNLLLSNASKVLEHLIYDKMINYIGGLSPVANIIIPKLYLQLPISNRYLVFRYLQKGI